MKGLVLCGGNSSRMGADKGLLTAGNTTWAQLAGDKLPVPAIYSVNAAQQQRYAERGIGPLLIDHPTLDIGGPLKGLLTAHLAHPSEDWLVLACDLRDMHKDVLSHLTKTFKNSTTVYELDGGDEPLCGIYTATDLARLAAITLPKHSMRYALSLLSVHRLPIPEHQRPAFRNYNQM